MGVGAPRRDAGGPRVPAPTSTPPTSTVSVHGSNAASTRDPTTARLTSASRGRRARSSAPRRADAPTSRAGNVVDSGRRWRPRAASVPRASAFSSSVSVSTRSARISSISVESKRSPGALGRDRRMVVEDDRRREHHGRRPRRSGTGKVPSLWHAASASAASSGGSSSERNVPSSTASSVCTATSEWRTISSLDAPALCPARRVLDRDTRAPTTSAPAPARPARRRRARCPTPAHDRAPLGQRCRTRPRAPRCPRRRAARTGTTERSPSGNTEIGGRRSRARPPRPTAPTGVADHELVRWREPLAGAGVPFERPVLHLQAANPYVQSRRVAGIDHGLGARR